MENLDDFLDFSKASSPEKGNLTNFLIHCKTWFSKNEEKEEPMSQPESPLPACPSDRNDGNVFEILTSHRAKTDVKSLPPCVTPSNLTSRSKTLVPDNQDAEVQKPRLFKILDSPMQSPALNSE